MALFKKVLEQTLVGKVGRSAIKKSGLFDTVAGRVLDKQKRHAEQAAAASAAEQERRKPPPVRRRTKAGRRNQRRRSRREALG